MPRSMFNSLLQPDLQMMLDENDAYGLEEFCKALFPGVSAEVLEGLNPADTWRVLDHCDAKLQAEIIQYFPLSYQEQLVESIDRPSLSKLIEQMPPDDRVDLLNRLDSDRVDSLLPLVNQAERADIRKLLSYDEHSAGSIMTTEYASLPENITVGEALSRLRLQAPSRETIYYIYIVDEGRHLLGFLSLRDLILAKPTAKLGDVMQRDVLSLRVDDDQEQVAKELARYDFIAIPIVDDQNCLVGIVTHDDVMDVFAEEATEDAHRQAAMEPLEDSYLDTPLFELVWKRGIWLVILLGAAFLTAATLKYLEPAGWMVLFIPLVLASGGNAGSQSATLVIRTMALEKTEGKVKQIGIKELLLGSLLGACLAALSFVAAIALVTVPQAAVVAVTVFLVVVMGTVTGSMLPIGFSRLGLDPALMSNPLIAALVDVLGVIIYSKVADMVIGTLVA